MEHSGDMFHTFMDLDSVIYLAVNGTSHKPPGFHPKYLKLCSEDKQSFLRVWNDLGKNFHFGVE